MGPNQNGVVQMSKIIVAAFIAVALAKSAINVAGIPAPAFHTFGWEQAR